MSPRLPRSSAPPLDNDQMPTDPPAAQVPPDWAQIYEKHRPVMWKVAVAALHSSGRVKADALDVVNDAFISIMNNPPTAVANWEALLVTATLRRAKDRLGQAELRHTDLAPGKDDGEIDAFEPPPAEDTADVVIRQLQGAAVRARLMEAISVLPARQQEVVRLRIIDSEPIGAIATQLKTSSANVSQLLKNALRTITETLTPLDELSPADIDRIRPARGRKGEG
nr:hypothetical protein GCM10020063_082150 [Dactylosporangium thailandense]